jgi:hypothetical protein
LVLSPLHSSAFAVVRFICGSPTRKSLITHRHSLSSRSKRGKQALGYCDFHQSDVDKVIATISAMEVASLLTALFSREIANCGVLARNSPCCGIAIAYRKV